MTSHVVLATEHMKVGPEGVESFFWPLAQRELQVFREVLLCRFVSIARARQDAADIERDLFAAFCQSLVRECVGLFVIHALLRRIRAAGREPVCPPGPLYGSLTAGRVPAVADSAMVRTLMKGPPPSAFWRRAAAKRVRDVAFNGLGWRALRGTRPALDIVACYPTPVLVEHARAVSDTVKYSLLDEWFGSLTDAEVARAEPLNEELRREIRAAVREAFEAGGEPLPPHLSDYVDGLTVQGSRLARSHLDKVLADPDRVPRRLWTGSGAYVWTRLLRHAVRRQGGEVVGHEHGTGEGLIADFNSKAFMDLESADRFVTFNTNQSRWLTRTIEPKYVIPPAVPPIEVPRFRPSLVKYAGGALRRRSASSAGRVRPAVMYVASIYCGDQPRMAHHNADLVIADWQARLIARVRAWGYDVLFKAHPDGSQRPPAGFARELGATFVEGRLEEVWSRADTLIFDWKSTSALSVAMSTDVPVVIVDFDFERFVPEAQALIERRCSIVNGSTNSGNRLHVDWEELKRALKEPRPATDRQFVEAAMRFG